MQFDTAIVLGKTGPRLAWHAWSANDNNNIERFRTVSTIFWSDGAHFHLNESANKQHCLYKEQNPLLKHQQKFFKSQSDDLVRIVKQWNY